MTDIVPATDVETTDEPRRTGWVILALATITAALTGPGQTIGVAVFIDHFVDDLDLSRSTVGTAYLVGTLAGATMLPRVGRLLDRWGVRRGQVVVGLLFGLALANMSLVNGVVWLTIGFVGIRLLGQGALSLIATLTVSLSFVRNRGTAIGFYSTFTAGLMALVPVALAFVIAQAGWRSAWLVAAVVVTAVVVPIGWFGLRGLPRGTQGTAGTRERGGSVRSAAARPHDHDARSVDRGTALRTPAFWVLATSTGAASMLGTALNFHQIDLMGEVGITETVAAALFIPQVVGSTIAAPLVGVVLDRTGGRFLPAVGMVLLILSMLLATVIAPGWTVIVYAISLGAMGGALHTTTASLLPAWFGTRHLGSIQGALTLFTVSASAVGPVTLALTQSAFGSYAPALLLLTLIPVGVLVFCLSQSPEKRPT